jgi:hypothetical protein
MPSVLTDYNAQFVGDGFVVEHVVRGETVGEVLSRAHHHRPDMLKAVRLLGLGCASGLGRRSDNIDNCHPKNQPT